MRRSLGIIALVVATGAAGCTPFGKRTSALAQAAKVRAESSLDGDGSALDAWMSGPVAGGLEGPPEPVTREEAMERVAPDLARLAQGDAALHAEVLDQIAGSPPSVWEATVASAVGKLEYRQGLGRAGAEAIARAEPVRQDSQVVQAGVTTEPPIAAQKPDTPAPAVIPNRHMPSASEAFKIVKEEAPPAVIANPHVASNSDAPSTGRYPSTGIAEPQLTEAPISAVSATSPVGAAAVTADWRTHLRAAIEAFERDAPSRPRTATESRDRVRARLLQLAAGDAEAAAAPAVGLSEAEQAYWSSQLWAMATLLDETGSSDPMIRADATAEHQREASSQLRSMGSLQVRNLAAVREVYGFGAYESIRDATYAPGDRVVLYAEIDHYTSKSTAEGYRTALKSSYRLRGYSSRLKSPGVNKAKKRRADMSLSACHLPSVKTQRSRCAFCSSKENDCRSNISCNVCNVPLCLNAQRNCFSLYHE